MDVRVQERAESAASSEEEVRPTLHYFRGGIVQSGGVALCGYRFRGLAVGPPAGRLWPPSDCPVCDDLRGM